MSDTKHLNPQQLAAIEHISGPLLIIAGAGTGKTTVVTERIKWLIAKGLAKPSEILALTFTEKAALEMQNRLDEVMPLGYTRMWLMTFHGFCENILREQSLEIGLTSNFKLLSETGSITLLKKHLFEFKLDYYRPLGNPHKFLSAILTHFSRLQDEEVSPTDYQKWADSQSDPKYQELSGLYSQYQKIKEQVGVLDFGDLIFYTLKLFRDRPRILNHYREQFKYLLVDEFQDTNYAQNQLLELLINSQKNITVVADDDQAIYQWRGAAVGNVLSFKDRHVDTKIITLTQNYRSTQEILDHAYKLISYNNPDRLEIAANIDKRLHSVLPTSQNKPIQVLSSVTALDEATAVALKIKNLKVSPKDIAILVRANAHAEIFIQALNRLGIASQFLGPGKLFLQPEIKDLIALIRVLDDPTDSTSLYRLLRMPFWKIPAETITSLLSESHKTRTPVFNILTGPLKDQLSTSISSTHSLTPGQTIYNFLEKSGFIKNLFTDSITVGNNYSKFFEKITEFETDNPETSLRNLIEWIDLSLEVGESPAATVDSDWTLNNAVNILTVHSSKGLEFPVVFMVNLVTGRFPSLNRHDPIDIPEVLIKEKSPKGDPHIQEERRLFYVGMTRAKQQLFFSHANYYGEGVREKKPSPFISEVLENFKPQLSISTPAAIYSPIPVKKQNANSAPVEKITYTQIQTFLDCPVHYKARYLLKLPSPPSASLSFGISMHQTLKDFYTNPGDIKKLLNKNWLKDGYFNAKHEHEFLIKGHRFLEEYQKKPYQPNQKSVCLEIPFVVPLTPNLKISGKIDRVDLLSDGSIEIIDYKTGKEKDTENDLQLSFYALAATLLPEPPFHKTPSQIKLTYYYFETQKAVTFTKSADDLKLAKSQILDYVQQISSSNFVCSGRSCPDCDYSILCDPKTTL